MKVLGTGTIVFAAGKDGGRDGTFTGVAQNFPSAISPLSGKFVVQSKHTSNPIASCSDAEFERLLKAEHPKVHRLTKSGELDHYMIFTNRKKPASKTIASEKAIKKLGPKSVNIFGIEQLREWLTHYPEVWKNLGFDRFENRIEIGTTDLTELVHAFHDSIKAGALERESATDFNYVSKTKKNKINGLSKEYDALIRQHSLKFFGPIEDFLKNPRNEELRDLYHDTADEIRAKLVVNGDKFDSFDEALTYLSDYVVSNVPGLRGKKRYVRVFLHYMYWTCDIGQHDHSKQAS
jgi:hypothetical protein